jgi:hypothetical protein
MKDIAGRTDAPVSRLACEDAVRELIARYGWSLLSADDLVERVLQAAWMEGVTVVLEQLITSQYKLALYEACRQTADLDHRRRAGVQRSILLSLPSRL